MNVLNVKMDFIMIKLIKHVKFLMIFSQIVNMVMKIHFVKSVKMIFILIKMIIYVIAIKKKMSFINVLRVILMALIAKNVRKDIFWDIKIKNVLK